ncbi:MAG: FHA domain-containing protein [Myxococcales bacterium]|nr:FHA domain-containing protein [Myxococcales bacterium]
MPGYRVIVQDLNYLVPPGETLIGRSDACGIVVKHNSVSRLHAALRLTDGGLLIEDLGSRNGTAVNGKRIQGAVLVMPGDVVILGQMVVDVVEGDPSMRSIAPARNTIPQDTLDEEPSTEKVTASAIRQVLAELDKKRNPPSSG